MLVIAFKIFIFNPSFKKVCINQRPSTYIYKLEVYQTKPTTDSLLALLIYRVLCSESIDLMPGSKAFYSSSFQLSFKTGKNHA